MALSGPSPLFLVRTAAGLSQGELARTVGKYRSTISRIENGEAQPSRELAMKIAEVFPGKITLEQIVFPELHLQKKKKKKPVRRASSESVAAHG